MIIELQNLQTKSKNKKRRKARGISAGQGRTAGRGNSGQKSRSGYKKRVGFEGGQNPLYRRVSKRGFRNFSRIEYSTINVSSLNLFENNEVVNQKILLEKGLIPKKKRPLKILGNGDLKKQLIVEAHSFSKEATRKIESLNGKAIIIEK